MLGENHSLTSEYPDKLSKIKQLIASDDHFADRAKRYDALDKEIRVLELRGSPIDDQAMHDLKVQRSELKDWLHAQLN
ncbi:YdcH family protein [Vibrio sp. SCSIO 43136]|uniref:YdcH family protein n=1 Tax=Vibrio sp. SCSIO 43136 TaxID=2819101 RepID=UPI002075C39B|nr:YdcH family protein [Vibrio sp. SCSIO 43136]USD67928.1 YdcH family protein [Vibrio sp. SCSIO 43136]